MSFEFSPDLTPISEPVPKSPEEAGFTEPAEQYDYFRSFIRGQQAASMLLQKEAHEGSIHDSLTGVLNLRGFQETIGQMEAEELQNYAVLYGDCTNFKAINDQLDHDTGDVVLKATVGVLQRSLREGTLLARVGGDEFVALVYIGPWGSDVIGRRRDKLTPDEKIAGIRERIEAGIQEDILDKHPQVAAQGYGFSVGIVRPAPGLSVAELKARAEEEMKEHKRAQHAVSGQYRIAGKPPELES